MYRIVLVVDEHFGCKLLELVHTGYVWIVQSGDNDLWTERVTEGLPDTDDPLTQGVSSFVREQNESTESLVIRVLDMIDEHHGEFAHEPPWSEVQVIGMELTDTVVEASRAYGVTQCETTRSGFVLER